MANANASQLDALVSARRGEGTLAVMPGPGDERGEPAMTSQRARQTIAVTVRLDEDRYVKLKVLGARTRRTNQDILVAALDAYLQSAIERVRAQGH